MVGSVPEALEVEGGVEGVGCAEEGVKFLGDFLGGVGFESGGYVQGCDGDVCLVHGYEFW